MASITQQNIGLQHEKITVHFTKEDYLENINMSLKKISKEASLAGFRKGQVPLGHIKKIYGQSVFTDEIVKMAGIKLEEYLNENKFEVFARPLPSESQQHLTFNINDPIDYHFDFEIAVKPNFDIPLLKTTNALPFYKVAVSQDMIQEEIDKLLIKAGTYSAIEEVKDDDNVIHFTLITVDEIGNKIEGGIDVKHSLLLSYFSASYIKELKNKKNGYASIIELSNCFDEKYEDAIFKQLHIDINKDLLLNVKITLDKIEHVEKALLNEDFFEKIYPKSDIDTLDKFNDKLKSEIQQYWDGAAKSHLQNDIFERLVHETPIDIPDSFMKRWMSIGGDKFIAMEQVEKEYPVFDHQIRWQLISNKIVEDNNISVNDEEMENAAKIQYMNYMSQYGNLSEMDATWLDPLIKKQLADKKFASDLANKILTDKLFAIVESQLPIIETEIKKDDFIAMINKPHHHHHH